MGYSSGWTARTAPLKVDSSSIWCTPKSRHSDILKIFHSIGSTKARRYPLSYIFSGRYYWNDGYLYDQDSGGYWWSSLANSSTSIYYLSMYGSGLRPQDGNNNIHGFALRYATKYFLYILSKTHHANAWLQNAWHVILSTRCGRSKYWLILWLSHLVILFNYYAII